MSIESNCEERTVFSREGFRTDLSRRILEEDEVISGIEGERYANRKDDRSLTYKMVAQDVTERANLKQDSRVLEVCCAAGQLANELAKYVKPENIVATDGGVELIDAANKRYGSTGIKFNVQNIHEMSEVEGFDCVICKDSFHHFPDPVQAIKELMAPLREGGTLYIFDLCRSAKDEQIKSREENILHDHEGMRFLRSLNASHTPEEFIGAAEKAGAYNVQVVYPFHYSEENMTKHEKEVVADAIKEFRFDSLFVVYILKKEKAM